MKTYSVKIIVATHKSYVMPKENIYIPVHVGAAGKKNIGYQRDDEGENISNLNPYYCELTGLYWAWKNLKEDYIGLVHYRRLFVRNKHNITYEDLEPDLGKIKVFVPQKRWYCIESLKTHYEHTHYPDHLMIVKLVIEDLFPEYLRSYERVVHRRWGYMFNMMIMERKLIDDYCSWLFEILDNVFNKIDSTGYSNFEKRYIGRISEILFNVWLYKKINDGEILRNEIKEISCSVEENWLIKIPAFLRAKYFGKKYEGSF